METIHRVPQPVIASVHGVATAAGCQLVAACDLAVATEDARFATPGVKIGLFCSTPMVPLSRAIGRKRALEMLLTGDIGKEAFYAQIELDEHRAYDLTRTVMAMNSMAADAQEGICAFLEKREP